MTITKRNTSGSNAAKAINPRSQIMRSIRGKNTKPEMTVRRMLTRLGFRYRIHPKGLPGRPDVAFIGSKKAIFVNGCFWHQHDGCRRSHVPKSRQEYWTLKLARNVDRDREHTTALRDLGWQVAVIWECETDRADLLAKLLWDFLSGQRGDAIPRMRLHNLPANKARLLNERPLRR